MRSHFTGSAGRLSVAAMQKVTALLAASLGVLTVACETGLPVAVVDAWSGDGTIVDGGSRDTGTPDGAPSDTGTSDVGPIDTGLLDTGLLDTGPSDAGLLDAGPSDAWSSDAWSLPPCEPAADDYTPRDAMSSTDTWPACISDDDTFHPIGASIGSIARVESFERIFAPSFGAPPVPGLLVWEGRDPSAMDFLDARTEYQIANGLDSRVSRRTDEHYPPPATGSCTMTDVALANPDYCVGPVQLQPAILASLNAGITGDTTEPARVYAARIEALLVWFLYVSPYKESLTCTTTPTDCDSAWAYYTGGVHRSGGLGLARLVDAEDAETHDRIWDGLLAVRCWRDLDPAAIATDIALRDRAREQADRAFQHGVILLVERHLDAITTTTGSDQLAHFAWLAALARVTGFDRMVRAADASLADDLAAQLADATATPAAVDVAHLVSRLRLAFPCP